MHCSCRIVEHASRHFRHAPAGITAHVLVVILADLVIGLAVAHVDPPNDTFAFHRGDGAKYARIISPAKLAADRFVQLVDGPRVSRAALENIADGIGNWAGTRHIQIIAR